MFDVSGSARPRASGGGQLNKQFPTPHIIRDVFDNEAWDTLAPRQP
jgi:hypothetical protein